MTEGDVRPGMRVRVTQVDTRREGARQTDVEGRVMAIEPRPTGAWFAHGKDDKFWLVRVTLEKDDGELWDLILDRNTRITILDGDGG